MMSVGATATGVAIGLLIGLFGVGGSSVATPLLALIGVAPFAAVASPLPATIPAAAFSGLAYVKAGEARPQAAAWTLLGAIPGTIAGALLSSAVGGGPVLIASGIVLALLGLRLARTTDDAHQRGTRLRKNRPVLVAASAGVGLFTGLLANSGSFLLVPLYSLFFGLRIRQAIGTSFLVVAVLSVPTLATHWALGHIDWAVAGYFALGVIPTTALAMRLSFRFRALALRRALGITLVVLGVAFTCLRALGVE